MDNRPATIPPPAFSRGQFVLLGGVLVVATAVAYAPSLRGGFIWDDPDYVVNNMTLRSVDGLWRMWTDIRSLPQWYPLVHTTYWAEYQLFGLNPLVFKLTNLLLHIATALLLWRLLRVLAVPGAYMGTLVFALHPVHVESVAWITERKNALSGLLYVSAFLVYWRWWLGVGSWGLEVESWRLDRIGDGSIHPTSNLQPPTHSRFLYALALALFVLAMFSKTVAATMPAAMLVVIWWKHGAIQRRDVVPLLPFFVIGIGMGLITAGLERSHVMAVGPEWDYAPTWYGELAARTLIAGRAVWFYIATLLWPHPLAFMYDRWTIDAHDWTQWLFPLAAVVVLVLLWALRNRIGRGPLTAALLFGGTLFPALGFFNVFPHRYSFVADHFQHLASIAITSLFCAGLGITLRRADRLWLCVVVQGLLVVVLGALTFRQGFIYESAETIWRDTAIKSPRSWVAQSNLGKIAADKGDVAAAAEHHRRALELAPWAADTWYNMAAVHASRREWEAARSKFERSRELSAHNPRSGVHLDSLIGLARIAATDGNDTAEAERLFKQAIDIAPDYPPARAHYARLLQRAGRTGEAIEQYGEVIERSPNDYDARLEAGTLLLTAGQFAAAVEQLEAAVQLQPGSAVGWTNLGYANLGIGQRARAMQSFQRALAIDPANERAQKGIEAARP